MINMNYIRAPLVPSCPVRSNLPINFSGKHVVANDWTLTVRRITRIKTPAHFFIMEIDHYQMIG